MKLLVAYDGSEHSESAVVDLQFAGLPPGIEAVVLSVLDDHSSVADAATSGGEQHDSTSAVAGEHYDRQLAVAQQGADLVRKLFPSWMVTAEVSVGSPTWEIIRRAETDPEQPGTRPFDLVVVGSRGHGDFKRLLFGSVAHRIVTTLQGSVRVSRRRPQDLNPQSVADVSSPPRVLLGVDGSPNAQAAVEEVASRHWPLGTRIVVATFVTGPRAIALLSERDSIWDSSSTLDSSGTEARPGMQLVSEAAEFLRRRLPGLEVTTLVRPADPKYGLLGAAESWNKDGADCIFVGATGVRGVARFLIGSVSTTVAMNATCSVEIVRRRP